MRVTSFAMATYKPHLVRQDAQIRVSGEITCSVSGATPEIQRQQGIILDASATLVELLSKLDQLLLANGEVLKTPGRGQAGLL